MRIKQKSSKRTLITVLIILTLLIGASIAAFIYNDAQQPPEPRDEGSINYDPPTQEEVEESQDAKKQLSENENKKPEVDPETKKKVAQVGVANTYTSDDSLEIRAFTPTVVEGGGTCTAKLTKGSAIISGSSEAFVDASTSQCRPIIIPLSKFPQAGVWKLTVTYESTNYSGASPSMDVQL